MTRIIAGRFGGRRIAVPRSGTRPTADRVREAVFSALSARIDFDGITVLDLYAGSGALGLEALSRGAAHAMFVEQHHRAAAVIAGNIADLGLGSSVAEVRRAAVSAVLAGGTDRPVDLVFADPPYDVPDAEIASILSALNAGGWAAPGAVAVVERRASGGSTAWPPEWSPWPQRRYGDTRIDMAELDG
ncbi:16S rRNA (guanine(966)-N(2))-methyltransferase RsmD [Mycolicibacterium sp. S2-37]|uniref:16S rRNA (guanine(966)-N(2))-methyltransferase RsmD n=1 Tax=Mycolicibacterium sp. S2-37 TaxID=2810297 RepID=UPI001A94DEE3|nr:16S rRNA (guanine(966)-N(2))-methyltransferase RsmD [Mycolicibacterium sp. S2-37]MBO0677251.1 16S rRNA (guanine(966)-N(2))-methyltransferase RsmD [Mycolicibacterium sp. S2-37]